MQSLTSNVGWLWAQLIPGWLLLPMVGFLIQQLHHLKALLSSRTHTATGTSLWVTLLLERNMTVSPSITASLHWSALTAFLTRYKWRCSARRPSGAISFFEPLLTIIVNEFSSKNPFVAVFSPLCDDSTFWQSYQNLPWKPSRFKSGAIGLGYGKRIFSSRDGRGCHLRKCTHTHVYTYNNTVYIKTLSFHLLWHKVKTTI